MKKNEDPLEVSKRETENPTLAGRDLAALREALLRGDATKCCALRQEYLKRHRGEKDPLVRLCTSPFDGRIMEKLPAKLKTDIAYGIFEDEALHLADHREFRHWLGETGQPSAIICAYHILEGRPSEARSMMRHLPMEKLPVLLPVLEGMLRLLEGRIQEAPESFAAALAACQKLTGRTQAALPGLGDIFWCLSLLARRGQWDLRTLHGRLEILGHYPPRDFRFIAKLLLQESLEIVFNQAKPGASIRPNIRPGTKLLEYRDTEGLRHPINQLLALLNQVWCGARPESAQCQKLAAAIKGRPFGAIGLCLEAMRSGKPHPLCNLLPEAPAWEKALNAITALAGVHRESKARVASPAKVDVAPYLFRGDRLPALQDLKTTNVFGEARATSPLTPAKKASKACLFGHGVNGCAAPIQNSRIAWRVLALKVRPEIEAYEQRRDAKGQWNLGVKIPTRALSAPNYRSLLTAKDRDVLACIVQDARNTGPIIHWSRGLLALVGHDAVLWTEDHNENGRPVELVKAQVRLRLLESPRQLTLRLEPSFDKEPVVIETEGLARVRVTPVEEAHRQLKQILGPGLSIPLNGKEKVLHALGAIAPLISVDSDLGLDETSAMQAGLAAVQGDPGMHLFCESHGHGLKVQLQVRPLPDGPFLRPGRGGETQVLESGGKQVLVRRDLDREKKKRQAFLASCPILKDKGQDSFLVEETTDCLELLASTESMQDGPRIHWPKGQIFQTPLKATSSDLRLAVFGKGEWFEASGELKLASEKVELRRLLELLQVSTGRFVPLGKGRYLALDENLKQKLLALSAFAGKKGPCVRFHRSALASLGDLTESGALQGDGSLEMALDAIHQAMNAETPLPEGFQATLRPYQKEGFVWMSRLAKAGLGACLADDMGLGKTVQALALLLERAALGPALVVAPVSLCGNWIRETRRFAPALNAIRYGEGEREEQIERAGPFDLIITTYGLLQQDLRHFERRSWSTLLLDEAQAIKNALTQRSQAAMALQGDFRLATTGTPVENHLLELWNLFEFINPGILGSQTEFQRRFQLPIERDQNPEVLECLKRLVKPFLLRRLKSEVLKELPGKTEITLEVEPEREEALLYEALRQEALSNLDQNHADQRPMQVLASLTRLRRACCHPTLVNPSLSIPGAKLRAFLELQEELREGSHRALVFSQFTDHLAILRKALDERRISYQYLDGGTSPKARDKTVERFQKGEGDLFLISLKAGGTGLNLTAADYVIHMDPWWNPAVEDQASDRAHRIGQQRPVTIYRLVMKGTVEQKITELHARKRRLADSLLEGSGTAERLDLETMMRLI